MKSEADIFEENSNEREYTNMDDIIINNNANTMVEKDAKEASFYVYINNIICIKYVCIKRLISVLFICHIYVRYIFLYLT
jgi:dTDP-4-dehydrorhamnose reductase